MPYTELFQKYTVPRMKYRTLSDNRIEILELVHGLYDKTAPWNNHEAASLNFKLSQIGNARDNHRNRYEVFELYVHYDFSSYLFVIRVKAIWNNSLKDVVNVDSINSFKNVIHKIWTYEGIMYNWKANLSRLDSWSGHIERNV